MLNNIISSDGNGKIVMQTWFALVTLLVLIISSVISVVALTVQAKSDIKNNTDDVVENKVNIDNMYVNMVDHEKRITTIETHYSHIREQLDRIELKVEALK